MNAKNDVYAANPKVTPENIITSRLFAKKISMPFANVNTDNTNKNKHPNNVIGTSFIDIPSNQIPYANIIIKYTDGIISFPPQI